MLGDLKNEDKRHAYLSLASQCWYVLGCNAKGESIATADEIPSECGVMVFIDRRLEVVRVAPKRAMTELPYSTWMALATVQLVDFESLEEGKAQLTFSRKQQLIEVSVGSRIQVPITWHRLLEISNRIRKYQAFSAFDGAVVLTAPSRRGQDALVHG